MADRRYKPVKFGFLNDAQDPTDISESESPLASSLDPDELALGALKHQQLYSRGTLKDLTTTTLGGRDFFLGSRNEYTTYDGTGYYESGYFSNYSFPNSEVFGGAVLACDVRLNATSDGYITGNERTALTGDGLMSLRMVSGNLILRATDSLLGTSVDRTVITSPSTDVWYRIVVYVVSESGANLDVSIFVDGARVFYLSQGYSPTVSTESNRWFTGGTNADSGASFDIRNFFLMKGKFRSPNQWDAIDAISMGPYLDPNNETNYYKHVLLTSTNGSMRDNLQGASFTLSGTAPSVTSTSSSSSGVVMANISSSPKDTGDDTRTELEITDGVTVTSTSVNVNVNPLNNLFLGFRLKRRILAYSVPGSIDVDWQFLRFEQTSAAGTRKGLELSLDNNSVKLDWEDSSGWLSASSARAKVIEDFYPGEEAVVSILITDESTVGASLYRIRAFVNGTKTVDSTTANKFDLLDSLRNVVEPNSFTVASAGNAFTVNMLMDKFYYGSIKTTASESSLISWNGDSDVVKNNVGVLISAEDGDLQNNDQGYATSAPSGVYPFVRTVTGTTGIPAVVDIVADDRGPVIPEKMSFVMKSTTIFDYASLTAATPTGSPTFNPKLIVQDGKVYNGPEDAFITFGNINYGAATDIITVEYRLDGETGFPNRVVNTGTNGIANLKHNLALQVDSSVSHSFSGEFVCQVKSPSLLDGDYKYVAVGVRTTDTDPKVEIESRPSDQLDVRINNLDAAGQRVASNFPVITVPAADKGYPSFTDRIDVYRLDPDSSEYVKVFSHSNSFETEFKDVISVVDLPTVEFLRTNRDENFTKINDAIGNDSGNYSILFEKDNRLWTVPADRKDLLLYSRENDWWGWRREQSFSFKGDIRDVVTIRDASVVSGESTLVVFTSKGIYHVVGSGTESSPYTRVPMFGGDGNSEIDMHAGSALPFNGSIFFISKSSDGNYDTGSYGQKVYQYDLQQLAELSGRVRNSNLIETTGTLDYATLVGGDKYMFKFSNRSSDLVYHKDARGWMIHAGSTFPNNDWFWKSKKFDRQSKERGTLANARAVKIDYKGDIILKFYLYDGDGNSTEKQVSLSSVTRTIWENVLPSNMGVQWQFSLESDSDITAEVYNMWFS